jgi:fused signal recognition particle receptor
VELHVAPFAPEGTTLRGLVRDRIAAEVDTVAGWQPTGRAHVVAAFGPSGAGKSASLVKLAEAYHRAGLAVAIVSLVAGEPARGSLASRMGQEIDGGADFDVRRVATVASARATRKALADHDLVLVDTPGACAADDAALEHACRLLKVLSPDEVHVVLPLSLAQREVDAALSRFCACGADRVLVTKLDEARFAGALLDLARRYELPLSYLGTGACLEGGLQVADGRLIAERILPI